MQPTLSLTICGITVQQKFWYLKSIVTFNQLPGKQENDMGEILMNLLWENLAGNKGNLPFKIIKKPKWEGGKNGNCAQLSDSYW